jgi:hypothetical protein
MTVLITLTTAGTDSGPFDLYSNIDGYTTAFETGVSKTALVSGYTSNLVPNSTITVRVKSTGVCTNFIDIPIGGITTTTSSSSSSTTTTTIPPTSKIVTVFNNTPLAANLSIGIVTIDGIALEPYVGSFPLPGPLNLAGYTFSSSPTAAVGIDLSFPGNADISIRDSNFSDQCRTVSGASTFIVDLSGPHSIQINVYEQGTACNYYAFNFSTLFDDTLSNACAHPKDTILYSNDLEIEVGSILYEKVTSGTSYYYLPTSLYPDFYRSSDNGKAYLGNYNGVVSEIVNCS